MQLSSNSGNVTQTLINHNFMFNSLKSFSSFSIEPPKIYPVLTDVECHTGGDYASSGYLHILRCPHSAATNGSCNNNDVIALSCGK